MALPEIEVVVAAKVADVAKHLEAFLWADDRRVEEGHEEPMTVSVTKINSRTFEEVETLDMIFDTAEAKTRYTLAADPAGTRVSITMELPAMLEQIMAIMPGVDAEIGAGVVAWGQRLEAYIGLQKQVGKGGRGVA